MKQWDIVNSEQSHNVTIESSEDLLTTKFFLASQHLARKDDDILCNCPPLPGTQSYLVAKTCQRVVYV